MTLREVARSKRLILALAGCRFITLIFRFRVGS
jgi:hypothetical protein